ncbi:hypothetical protein [Enterococcus faecalis]|uniref:hypothetical protein n=1 Tax=Enterococcus faecalis TaxID=1351 RepID=UPI0017834DEB|nr:hypothetical protein [Enterococcus faecalis]MBD9947506.1 hypothetical protein [Enterococcus faecalis]
MNEAEILAATYFDTCVIERMSDIENTESGITEQVYFPIHVGKLPCAFSQGSMGNLPVIENKEAFNISYEEQKLFLEPNIKVKKGDRITITQGTGQKHVLFSKKHFYYPSHIEVVLSGSSIDE